MHIFTKNKTSTTVEQRLIGQKVSGYSKASLFQKRCLLIWLKEIQQNWTLSIKITWLCPAQSMKTYSLILVMKTVISFLVQHLLGVHVIVQDVVVQATFAVCVVQGIVNKINSKSRNFQTLLFDYHILFMYHLLKCKIKLFWCWCQNWKSWFYNIVFKNKIFTKINAHQNGRWYGVGNKKNILMSCYQKLNINSSKIIT